MSKYIVSWADDIEGINLAVTVHDTLEDARKDMVRYWNELLRMFELPEGTTEFDLDDETVYGSGPYGSIGSDWLSYRNEDGFGDEVTITEVQA